MLQPRDVQGYLPGVQSIANDLIETLHSKRDSKNQIITLQDELGKYSQEGKKNRIKFVILKFDHCKKEHGCSYAKIVTHSIKFKPFY